MMINKKLFLNKKYMKMMKKMKEIFKINLQNQNYHKLLKNNKIHLASLIGYLVETKMVCIKII